MGVKFFNDINLESTGSINLGSTNYLTTDVGGQTDLFSNKNFIVSIGPSLSGVFEFAQNGIVTFLDDSTSTDFTFEPQNSSIRYTGLTHQGELYFDDATLTASRQWILPDATGTIALLSDIEANNELSEVLANGNTTGTNNILINDGQDIRSNTSGNTLNLDDPFGTTSAFSITQDNGVYGAQTGWLYSETNNGIQVAYQLENSPLEAIGLSVSASGIIANIYNGKELVIVDNRTSNANSGNFNKRATFVGAQNAIISNSVVNTVVAGGSGVFATASNSLYANQLRLQASGNGYDGIFDIGTLTTSRTYSFQDADGTVAFLSDLTNGIYTGSGNLSSNTVVSMHDGASPGTEFKLGFQNILSETVLSINPSINSVGIGTDLPLANLNVVGNTADAVVFKVDGTYGELFTITDNLTGVLFSVNNISGLPIFEVEDTDEIRMGRYTAVSGYTTGRNEIIATGDTIIHTVDISSYRMAVFEYVVSDGTNLRAGNVTAVTDGATVQSVETITTPSIGNTADITMSVTIDASPGELNLVATTASTTGWTVKTIVRTI